MSERSATVAMPHPIGVAVDWPVVPGFEVLQELGRGGMGVVYKARQISLKRLVALKVIRDGALAGPQERARFRIEAESSARMHHPNIVQIYEAGEHEGRPYFAMELVEGGSLDRHLAGRRQPPAEAAALVRTLALAVDHAHAQKIIHRDLKPTNVLLAAPEAPTSDHLDHVPKIADFGLAKRLDQESTAHTRDGDVVGTVSYMAPEQAAGRIRDLGPGVDIYALGAILYEALTGQPPFDGKTWNETLAQVLNDDPAPPTRLRADVPRDLETVCLKCLEKDPTRRYASAGALADDLERFLAGTSIAAVPMTERDHLARLAARDGYQLGEEIGGGPHSIVYRASHGPLQQAVALKVFAAGICTREEWEARVRHGAELGATISHPQVLPVQRAGWWDGVPYVVTEYVPNGSLSAATAYRIDQALGLVLQLAEIVSYLHRQGIVHGNLKPSNVLLAGHGIPRVVDFWFAAALFPVSPEKAVDAVRYLAPELTGAQTEPRFPTDIYGLGLILYELLAKRPPYRGKTAEEVLEQVRSQEPEPPSHFNSKLSSDLDEFCLRCLAKNPYRRYHRAYDVLTGLRRLEDEVTGTRR